MSRTQSYYDVRDALSEPGCPVCRLKARSVERYLDALLWENVTDPGIRADIRRARGFCHEHTWQLIRPAASLGVAIISRDVLGSLRKALEDARFQAPSFLSFQRAQEAMDATQPSSATAGLVARLAPQQPCPACKQGEIMEGVYLEALLEGFRDEDGLRAPYETSSGLCLPHLRRALQRLRDETTFDSFVAAQRVIWQRLAADLDRFIKKSDPRFRDEPWGDERDAWLRATAALAGNPREAGSRFDPET
jgi:hypothetical protein